MPDVSASLDFDNGGVKRVETTVSWQAARFPSANVYQLENEVFDVLGVPKRREVPVDVIVRTAVSGYITIALVLGYGVIMLLQDSGGRSWVSLVIGVFGFLLLILIQFGHSTLLAIGEIGRGSAERRRRREGLS